MNVFQEKERQAEEAASKKQRKPGQKRRGLGGLSKEKKRMLKVSVHFDLEAANKSSTGPH